MRIKILAGLWLCAWTGLQSQTIMEAEDAYVSDGSMDTEHVGYTGRGFVDTKNLEGVYIEWYLSVGESRDDSLSFRYALGKDEHRLAAVYVNQIAVDTLDFNLTGEFTDYLYKHVPFSLDSGLNCIRLLAVNPEGLANIDHLRISGDTIARPWFTLFLSNDGNGTVTAEPAADSFQAGQVVRLTPRGNPGYSFFTWSGDLEGQENPLEFPISAPQSVHATFKLSLPSFPGAEGYAMHITGGRGGEVYEVTNLLDKGPGSLRNGVEQSGKRTIVFRVSGTIHLLSSLQIKNGDITIAGQTAPGQGICLADYPLIIDADNVIIRFIRSRTGDVHQQASDAVSCNRVWDVIIDHCSFSWGMDEVASLYGNTNFILQWCLISEGFYDSYHHKGKHSYGGIWGGDRASFHHNLLAHCTSRMPRFNGARYYSGWNEQVDFRNNVIYNWGFNNIYGGEPSEKDGSKARINMVNNYFKSGPASSVSSRIIEPSRQDDYPDSLYSYFHVEGNFVRGYPSISEDNWKGGVQGVGGSALAEIRLLEAVPYIMDSDHSAAEAYEYVLAWSGCVLPFRDSHDERIINETLQGTASYGSSYKGGGNGIIDSQIDVGGWPELETEDPAPDGDHDGMPDQWELAHGLDPGNPEDRNTISETGYTWLEVFLNSLVEDYSFVLRPVGLRAEALDHEQVQLEWDLLSTNETGLVIERSQGKEWHQLALLPAGSTRYKDQSMEGIGTYSYRLKAKNETNESFYTDSVSVELSWPASTSGPSEQLAQKLHVFPNPSSSHTSLYFTLPGTSPVRIRLLDTGGRERGILREGICTLGNHSILLDTSQFPEGMYLVHMEGPEGNMIQKLFIAR